MKQVMALVGGVKRWWQGRQGPAARAPAQEKTLRDLMAEQGCDASGRKADPLPAGRQHATPGQAAIFVAEFSYGNADGSACQRRVCVVGLNDGGFHGGCHPDNCIQAFSWNRVRGLMKIVDSGEMLGPKEVMARYG